MILYHGTTDKNLLDILSKGITPRGSKESVWGECPSRPDCVYLTNAYGFFYAGNVIGEDGKMVILEVNVDKENLLPDEDFLEQCMRHDLGDDPDYNILATTWDIRDNLPKYKAYWADSLAGLGNAAHQGTIFPSQIKRYAIVDDMAFTFAFDPAICLANYSIMGAYYRNGMRWLFDPDCEMEPLVFDSDRNDLIRELPRTHIKISGG
jgi:hypothetical protein